MLQVQPKWLNKEKTVHVNPEDGAFNTLAESGEVVENPGNDDNVDINLLEEKVSAAYVDSESETQMLAEEQQQTMIEEDALLAMTTEQPPFMTECWEEEGESAIEGGDLLEGESDNPLGGIDGRDSEQTVAQSNEREPLSVSWGGGVGPSKGGEKLSFKVSSWGHWIVGLKGGSDPY